MLEDNKPAKQENEASLNGSSIEIVVKTEGDKSLRLNLISNADNCWKVTLPFDQPVSLSHQDGQWIAKSGAQISKEFAQEIGAAIEVAFPSIWKK